MFGIGGVRLPFASAERRAFAGVSSMYKTKYPADNRNMNAVRRVVVIVGAALWAVIAPILWDLSWPRDFLKGTIHLSPFQRFQLDVGPLSLVLLLLPLTILGAL